MKKTFPATLDFLHEMIDFVCQQEVFSLLAESDVYQTKLAIQEALVNIIKHAYQSQQGIIVIECESMTEKCVMVIITDEGIPYNPLTASKNHKIPTSIENASIGGYGTYFIFKIMDEIKYKREEGKNILTLIKRIRTQDQDTPRTQDQDSQDKQDTQDVQDLGRGESLLS